MTMPLMWHHQHSAVWLISTSDNQWNSDWALIWWTWWVEVVWISYLCCWTLFTETVVSCHFMNVCVHTADDFPYLEAVSEVTCTTAVYLPSHHLATIICLRVIVSTAPWSAILDVVLVEQYSFRYQEKEIAAVLMAIQTSQIFFSSMWIVYWLG